MQPGLIEGIIGRLRRRRVNRRAFQEFSRSLALIVDREALEASVAARIRELFDPDRMPRRERDEPGEAAKRYTILLPSGDQLTSALRSPG